MMKNNRMKKIVKESVIAVFALSALTIFSCEIGMGSAVDTDIPKVGISYPPKSSIIRDSFVVAGECSDDLALESVNVTVENVTTKDTFGPYEANLNEEKTSWTVTLNQKKEGDYSVYNSYQKWEFPDGDYIITAVALDKAGNSSQESSILVSVDNTAPVLIVSKPLSVGTEPAQKYGRTFSLAGDIAEAHSTSKLTIYYRRYNSASSSFIDSEARSISVSGFNAMSSDSPLVIAKYYSAEEIANADAADQAKFTEYRNNYLTIYGTGADSSTTEDRLYYCGFLLEDNALLYQAPGDSGSGNGNETSIYYINSDKFSEELADENHYNLNAQKLMEIINGSTKTYSSEQINNIIGLLNKDGYSASSKNLSVASSTKFNLNPANNPYWVLSGFDFNAASNTFEQTVQTGGKLPVIINAGTDGVLIDSSTVSVKIYRLGLNAASSKNENECITIIPAGSLAGDVSSLNPDITVDNTVQLAGQAFYKPNNYYELWVEGKDNNDVSIVANGYRYGFMLYSSAKAPDISCETPSDDTIYGTEIDTNGITITGSIKTEVADLYASTNNKDKLWVSGFEVTDATSDSNTDFKIPYKFTEPTINGSNKDFTFSVKIEKNGTKSLIPETPGKYKYAISLSAKDSNDGVGTATLIIYVDNKAPDTKIESISPLVKDAENKDCVNGTTTISGTVFDSGSSVSSINYKIQQINPDGTLGEVKKTGPLVANDNGAWELPIPTISGTDEWANKFTDGSSYRFIITAIDAHNNSTGETIYKDFKVDQSTDKPTISLQNSNLSKTATTITQNQNMFKPGEKISTQIDDDDGIGQIEVSYRRRNASGEFTGAYTSLTSKNNISIKPYPYDFEVPSAEGEYEIKIEVTDTVGNLVTSKNDEYTFIIGVDKGAPVLSEVAFAEDKAYYSKNVSTTLTVNGKAAEGSGVCTITPDSDASSITQPVAANLTSATGANWQDTITIPESSGSYSVTYTATDKYGYNSTKKLEYKVDNNKPELKTLKINTNTVDFTGTSANVWSNSKTLSVQATASDAGGSEVKEILFSKTNSANETDWSSMKKKVDSQGKEVKDSSGNVIWEASVDYTDSTLLNGDHLYIKVKDNAGNVSATKDITLTIDSTKPGLEVKYYKTEGTSAYLSNKTVYVNKPITIYGNYNDSLSGIKGLKFFIDSTEKTLTPTYYTSLIATDSDIASLNETTETTLAEGPTEIKAWSVTVPSARLATGSFKVTGEDKAGNPITDSSLSFIKDTEAPALTIDSVTNNGNPYQDETDETKYFIRNNTDGTITISGTTTDDFEIDHTELVITGNVSTERLPATGSYTATGSNWSFGSINMSSWTSTEASATITAYDKAGNHTETVLTLVFDEKKPVIVHGAHQENYKFRGKNVYKYYLIRLGDLTKQWNQLGKYSEYSYGQETGVPISLFVRQGSIEDTINNADEEEISGVAKVKYYLLAANTDLTGYSFTAAQIAEAANLLTGDASDETLLNNAFTQLNSNNAWTESSEFDIKGRQQYTADFDGNGINDIEAYGIKAEASISGFTMTSGDATNLLFLVPVDNCGNEGSMIVLSIHADNDEPVVTSLSSNSILTNGKTPFNLHGTVSDPAAGLKEINIKIDSEQIISSSDKAESGTTVSTDESTGEVTVSNSKATLKYTGYTDSSKTTKCTLSDSAAYVEWNVEFTPNSSWFNYGGSASPSVIVEAVDWAGEGNKNTQSIATLKIDNDPPVVTPANPVSTTKLYGIKNVTGTVSENNTPKSVSLYISTAATAPSTLAGWGDPLKVITTEATPVTPATNTTYDVSSSAIYNYNFADINFYDANLIAANAEKQQIHVLVVAEDEAGNKNIDTNLSSEVVTCWIDRNEDRPVVTITNVESEEIYGNGNISVNVQDEDGVSLVQYSTDNSTYNTITPTNGRYIITLEDGKQTLYFKVTSGSPAKTFTSTETNTWDRVLIKDAKGAEVTTKDSSDNLVFKTTIDLNSPDNELKSITKGSAYNSTTKAFTPIGSEITSGFGNIILGGNAAPYLKLRIEASDTSGIKNVHAEVYVNDVLKEDIIATKSTSTSEPDTYYAFIPCNVTGYDGALKLRIIAEDKAGREKKIDNDFVVDNTAPTIRVSTPVKETEQSGTITFSGTIDESVRFYYAVSPFETSPEALTTSTDWEYKYYEPTDSTYDENEDTPVDGGISLANICNYKSLSSDEEEHFMSFEIKLDGATDNPVGVHSDTLNTWLTKMKITKNADLTAQNPFDRIVYLWLHTKAIDDAGNVSENHHKIYVDPQGNRPKVTMTYPAEPTEENQKITLGGTVTLMGTAMGMNPIDAAGVELKIDGTAYAVTKEGAGWSCPIDTTALNNTDEPKKVTITVTATDSEENTSRTLTREVWIDKDTPVVNQNLRLVQWKDTYSVANGIAGIDEDDGTIQFVANSTSANIPYEEGKNISGAWNLVGYATDNSAVAKISYKIGNGSTHEASIGDTAYSQGGVYIKKQTVVSGDTANYNCALFSFPVGVATDESVGSTNIKITVYDNSDPNPKEIDRDFTVYYDNKKPELVDSTDSRYNISSSVFNSNSVFNFGSVATEAAVNSVNQTGVKRIAFYFTKELTQSGTTTYSIFDPAIRSGSTGNTISSTSAPNETTGLGYGGLVKSDGLWWKKKSGTDFAVSNSTVTLPAADANIHVGSIAKINGAIYSVIEVSGTTITLDGTPGNASEAYFAMASIVDNALTNGTVASQSIVNQGSAYIWNASIDSKNLPDGSATLHYVVFDGAGNHNGEDVTCLIENKAPRIVGMTLGTDDNGNGSVDTNEFIDLYSGLFTGGVIVNSDATTTRSVNVTFPTNSTDAAPKSALKLKGKTVIKPEVVGGTGDISYTYSIAKRNTANNGWAATAYYNDNTKVTIGEGTGDNYNTPATLSDIELDVETMVTKGIASGNNQKFIFKIADSTPGTPLVATMNVVMDVLLMDETAPENKIIPFYWKSLKNNSLYASEAAEDWRKLNGHIELPDELPAAFTGNNEMDDDPKVSGKIKIEGIARDDVLLKTLSVDVSLGSKSFTLAEFNNGVMVPATETMKDNGWSAEIKHATFGEYKDAGYIEELPKDEDGETYSADSEVPYFSQEYGHVVHWILNLDTEKLSDTKAKTNVSVTAKALDRGKPTNTGAYATEGGKNKTDSIQVDIVPYILGIKGRLSEKAAEGEDSSEYDRTALGHYPLASTDKANFYGFNLKKGAKVYDKAGAEKTALAAADTSLYTGFTVYPTTDTLASFTSGEVSVTVDGVKSLNNLNDNDSKGSYIPEEDEDAYTTNNNSYNRKPNTVNNYILTDDVFIDVWEFNDRAAKTYIKGVPSDPIMKINPNNGIIGFAYQSGTRRFNMGYGNSSSYQGWQRDFDNLSSTGFAYDSAGNSYGCAQGGDINSSFSVSTFCFFTSLWGVSGIDTDYGALNGPHAMRVEEIGQIGKKGEQQTVATNNDADKYIDKSRVLSPSITVSGSGANATVYLAYYDHLNREIRFRWADKPNTGGDTKGWKGTSYITDDYTEGGSSALNSKNDTYNYYKHFQIIAENANEAGSETTTTTLGKPGPYVDIAVIPANATGNPNNYDIVVMVWYDSTNNCLRYTYNDIALNSTKDASNNNISFVGSGDTKKFWHNAEKIFTGAGEYCKIAVDAAGGVHIAGYDSILGDVRYAYLSSYGEDYNEETDSCIVDASGIVGSDLTLDVAKDELPANGGTGEWIPYIGYYGSTGPKMAYFNPKAVPSTVKTTAGKSSIVNDMFTGYWEVTEVPTPSNAPKDRINVGVWKDENGVIKDSTSTKTEKTPDGDTTTATDAVTIGNGTKNPVLGYQIRPTSAQGYIETAQMQ